MTTIAIADFAKRDQAVQRDVSLDALLPNRYNPRQEYPEETLAELVQSIEEHGFIGALDGRELPDGRVELAYGSRRLLAAKAAGVQSIPIFLHDWDDEQLRFISLVENLVREDLTLHEQAEMVGQMHETLGFSIRKLARKLGKPKSWVEDRLALYRAPQDVKEMVSTRPDTARAASYISRLPDEESRRILEQSVLDQEATTRQVQKAVQQILDQDLPAQGVLAMVTMPLPAAPPSPPIAGPAQVIEPIQPQAGAAPAAEPIQPPVETEAAETEPTAIAFVQTVEKEVETIQRALPRKRRIPLPDSKLLLRANQSLDRFDLRVVQDEEVKEFANQLEQIVARATFLLKELKERLDRESETLQGA